MPIGRVGDQPASLGERPVSRVPSRSITAATVIIRAAVSMGGIVSEAPIAPSAAPKTA